MLRAFIALVLLAWLQGSAFAQTLDIRSEGPVVLKSAQQLVLHSRALGRDVLVRIAPPATPPPAGEKAAAVYVLDGNWYFGLASDTLGMMALENQTWPAYLIAIGYDTSNPAEVMTSRANDYLHTVLKRPTDAKPQGGGGATFETFIIDELKPFIEARLAVNPSKSFLAGHSYGGLFVSNLIARRPGAFSGYLIGSPSVWADGNLVAAVGKAKGAGRPVFLGVGEKEVIGSINMVIDAGKLGDALERAGFAVTRHVHQGQTHSMEPNVWMAEGLRVLLAKPKR